MASFTLLMLLGLALPPALGHIFMYEPAQRGALWGNQIIPDAPVVDKNAPRDYEMHFPAGDKSQVPGAGTASQRRAAGGRGWTEFKPEKPEFVWRSGVCGDLKSKPDHLFGGKFYYGGKIVKTYKAGGEISISIGLAAHHNGYVQFRLCDMSRCDGKMSERCFRNGGCQVLDRVRDPSCESRTDMECGPIDSDLRYASNWHLPCSKGPGESFGHGKIRYKIPPGWAGPHFVLHMYYVAANDCMPPGVTDYFKGPRGPKWGDCPGQGGARGGFRPYPGLCGGSKFPEEYYQCADIAISGSTPGPVTKPIAVEPARDPETVKLDIFSENAPVGTPVGSLKTFKLFADGKNGVSFAHNSRVVIDVSSVKKLTFKMETRGNVPFVRFSVNKAQFWTEEKAPYFYMGNFHWGIRYWDNAVFNKEFVLRASNYKSEMVARVTLTK